MWPARTAGGPPGPNSTSPPTCGPNWTPGPATCCSTSICSPVPTGGPSRRSWRSARCAVATTWSCVPMPEQTGPPEWAAGDQRGVGMSGVPDAASGRLDGPGDGVPGGGPDFFDRLLARYAPTDGRPRGGPVRVRPRLPEPFERVEVLGGADDAGY